jgi:hypothetical protein
MLSNASSWLKITCAAVLFLAAIWTTYRAFVAKRERGDQAFFYDLSEQELFTAPRSAIPPIQGLNDGATDAVRAVVISTNGDPKDKASWQVSYLEIYTPELKAQMEQAQSSGESPSMGRARAQTHRLVRRVDGEEWYPMNTTEAEAIISAWLTAGPGGGAATICTP